MDWFWLACWLWFPWRQGATDYSCPATNGGARVLNWKMADSRGDLELKPLNPDDASWTWTASSRNVRIVCGYMRSTATVEIPVAGNLRRCENPGMTHDFHCR